MNDTWDLSILYKDLTTPPLPGTWQPWTRPSRQ